ncbi:MAG: nitroreductase family protein [Prevotellaceae bacterium]|nr:nitroreductase family protein [Prevotellaceae bacterium]
MTLQEAIVARHSVRKYIKKPLSEEIVAVLNEKIEECNRIGGLHIQLVTNEPKAFSGIFAYGKFSGVENYIVMIGAKSDDLDKRIGYYGEQLVLLAQTLGLNTCWAGLSYRKVKGTYQIADGEKLACMIALGYGETQGIKRKSKTLSQVSNIDERTPEWFRDGIKAALLAPTAINQQKFYFRYIPADNVTKPQVMATTVFSMVGYTNMDLGIAKLHFELGAGKENFEWR